jgi:hypothetical protein
VEIIITQLSQNARGNQDAAGNPDGKSDNIDECVQLFLPQIAEGEFEVAFEHDDLLARGGEQRA